MRSPRTAIATGAVVCLMAVAVTAGAVQSMQKRGVVIAGPSRPLSDRRSSVPWGDHSGLQDHVPVVVEASRSSRARSHHPPTAGGHGSCSLDYIRSHESGGNYQAVSRNGMRGAYQFQSRTWIGAVSRSGHPEYASTPADQAPREMQDAAAAQLYSERGSAPWSVCR